MPLPKDVAENALDIFSQMGDARRLTFEPVDPQIPISADDAFLLVEDARGSKVVHIIRNKFPLQFAREVVCSADMLAVPERVDWKECAGTIESQTEETKAFRAAFKAFDFTRAK